MTLRGTDTESCITEYSLVCEEKCNLDRWPGVVSPLGGLRGFREGWFWGCYVTKIGPEVNCVMQVDL